MNFELEKWGDGTVCLVHWDSLHGEDIFFKLYRDGTILMSESDAAMKPVDNLCLAMRRVLEQRQLRDEAES